MSLRYIAEPQTLRESALMRRILGDIFLFEDTCNVYAIRTGQEAVLIDFGSGGILDHLAEIGVERVTDVLITHHHRDQCQGLQRAVDAGIRIWVPHTEQDLFARVDAHWQAREIANNYNNRQDRFSLLEPVPVNGTLRDYEIHTFGGREFTVIPTPGHTIGSLSLLIEEESMRIAFTGDLIAAPGKVWSMAATQWSYNGAEGAAASIPSLLDLKEREVSLLLPSHGGPIDEPGPAIDLLVERFARLLRLRGLNPRLFELRDRPYEAITPHLLRHRASLANTYVLLSKSGKALFFDFGYDFVTGIPSGSDRASRRPWLYTLPALKRQFGVDRVDVVIPTHYHDDHVAGINLLRAVEGTQLWAADRFATILEAPERYDLPCLWYDPIPVDRRLPMEVPIQWEEYTLTLHPLPGHTLYAVAVSMEVDGQLVLVTGDQYQGNDGLELNYVYANRYQAGDYSQSAALYRRINPDLILTGHWDPLRVTPGYLDQLEALGNEFESLHSDLLLTAPAFGAEESIARINPYQVTTNWHEPIEFQVELRNPFDRRVEAAIQMIVPEGWQVVAGCALDLDYETPAADTITLWLPSLSTHAVVFGVVPPAGFEGRRARAAVDITLNGQRFGQQAEALISAAPLAERTPLTTEQAVTDN